LYRITLINQQQVKSCISSQDAEKSDIKIFKKNNTVLIRINNEKHSNMDITTEITCTIKSGSPLTYWRAKIKNRTNTFIKHFEFPIEVCSPQLGEFAEDDYLLQCGGDGYLIKNPMKNIPVRDEMVWGVNYPGYSSLQFMSFQDDEGGLYYATYDGNGYSKGLHPYRRKDGIQMIALHKPPMEYGKDYDVPYDTVLGVVKGDWYNAADIYKEWAIEQKWCSKKTIERKDVPEWLKKGPFFHGNWMVNNKELFPKGILENTKSYRDYLGMPIVVLLFNWEQYGQWTTPDYFPSYYGDKLFKELTDSVRNRGDYSFVYLSGLRWTLEKKQYKDKADFDIKGKPSAIINEKGDVLIEGNPDDREVGKYSEICCGTNLARNMLLSIVKECQQQGLDIVQLDQIVGGGQQLCYSKLHNHKPADPKYQYESLHKIFSEILKEGQKRNKNFVWALEEPNELYIQCLNMYHARDYAQNEWPRSYDKEYILGIPVFTYIYHEYMLGYGGTPFISSYQNRDKAVIEQGFNFIYGKAPALAILGMARPAMTVEPATMPEDFSKTIKSISNIMKTKASKYLMMGKMLHPLELNVFTEALKFIDDNKVLIKQIQFPSILNSVYESPDGKGTGCAFFNWTSKEVNFNAPISTYTIKEKKCDVLIYGKDGISLLSTDNQKPITVTLTINPCEAVFVEIIPKK
jgi:hypothetical protein